MRRPLAGVLLVMVFGAVLVLGVSLLAFGQPLAPATCEDNLRTLRVLVEQYAQSRQRQEIEAAQAVSGLLKQVDVLQQRVRALEAPPTAPPPGAAKPEGGKP